MIINHNISALNTFRQLSSNNVLQNKSLEKLSSGFRINRAGDDAAGLAISEKMRGQIRGLDQATRNAQDGISLIQTAEGALNETHAILQRMRELAVQSSTDTNTSADRGEIQKEINQLASEITRIAETTEFNTQSLLDGKFNAKFHIGANAGQNVDLDIAAMDANALQVAGSGEGKAAFEVKAAAVGSGSAYNAVGLTAGEHTLSVVEIDNVTLADGSSVANYGLANDKGEIVATSIDGKAYALLDGAYKTDELAGANPAAGTQTITFADPVTSGEVALDVNSTIANSIITAVASVEVKGLEAGTYKVVGTADAAAVDEYITGMNATGAATVLQVLVNADDEAVAVTDTNGLNWFAVDDLTLGGTNFAALTAGATAIMTVAAKFTAGDEVTIAADGGIDVSTQLTADKAITTINDAISTVSSERSKLGAMQNRLDHTINNLGASAENLQAAESRIRDVDMAKEMMEFTKMNILSQAATAMLAQANQQPQMVLQLLR